MDERAIPHRAALFLMPAVVGLAILIGPAIGALGLVWMAEFPLIQLFCIALPALVAARASTSFPAAALGLRLPSGGALAGAILFGASFWYLNAALVAPLLAEHASESDRVLAGALAEEQPLWLELLVLALVPSVCEELLVRGAITRGLAPRFGALAAVLMSSGYFALLHVSLARALPTAVLGVFLALAVLRSGSVLTSIIIHGLNNAAAVLLGEPAMAGALGWLEENPATALPAALLAAGVGFSLLRLRR